MARRTALATIVVPDLHREGQQMSRLFVVGAIIASVVLIAFGIGSIVIGATGRSDVSDKLEAEDITGSPDMTPRAIAQAADAAGLKNVELPTCSVADEVVDTGDEAKCFAEYMRIHSLEATGGKTYAQMPRFATADGKGTNDAEEAETRPDGSPMDNPARSIWVTETALGTALNVSFFAQQVALFSIVMGVALLLTGIGFLVLVLGARQHQAVGDERGVERPAAARA
jgi:hypothetical protein